MLPGSGPVLMPEDSGAKKVIPKGARDHLDPVPRILSTQLKAVLAGGESTGRCLLCPVER